ncbi:glutamate--tRNA ligase [Ectothiorhodospiraceae bacterium 2226]|nr:glutamate--tRNA ligase [Ectothiorhodospiraceae bacterium 2226]
MTIRTRFAPSPTGYLHIGGARTALFSWLYARKHAGRFILRIEDTDRERSTVESVNAILEGMTWLGLNYDEGPLYQTERFDRYKAVIEQLLAEGKAYRCYCSKEELEAMREEQMARKEKPRYDARCRVRVVPPDADAPYVIRFRNPEAGQVVVEDQVRGRVVFDNRELDDLVIARADGTPTYNLTVVVDDMEMGVTHVIRGDDHLNNTPRQINIIKALGGEPPLYAHVPMILGDDGKRLSKRHGAVSVMQYREDGFLPEAVLNYLVRLGWSHGDQEIFSLDEMATLFDIKDINSSASAFNTGKLLWLNQHYIKTSDPAHIARHLSYHLGKLDIDPAAGGPPLVDVIKAQQERAKTLVEMAQNSVYFYRDVHGYDDKAARKHLGADCVPVLRELREALATLEPWAPEAIHDLLNRFAERHELKLGKVAQPLRVAMTGNTVSPPIDVTLALIGRERVVARIDAAVAFAEQQASASA